MSTESKKGRDFKRVLMFCYEYPPLGGGGSDFVRDFLEGLTQEHGLKVDLICYGSTKHMQGFKDKETEFLKIYRVGSWFPRKERAVTNIIGLLGFPFFALVKSFFMNLTTKYDLVYSFFTVPSGWCGMIHSLLFRKDHYVSVIGGDIYKPTKKYSPHKIALFGWGVKVVINLAHRVSSISNDVKNRLFQFYPVRRETKVDVLALGKPYGLINTDEVVRTDNEFRFVSLARLDSRKRFNIMIDAFAKADIPNSKLTLMGDGPEADGLKKQVKDLGLTDKVDFLGFVSNELKYETLNNSDCFVLTSAHEGFGLVYLEGLRCGLPVISTDNGGVRDIVQEGYNGTLTEVDDVDAISEAMKKFVEDGKYYQSLKSNAYKSSAPFSIENAVDRYAQFLNS